MEPGVCESPALGRVLFHAATREEAFFAGEGAPNAVSSLAPSIRTPWRGTESVRSDAPAPGTSDLRRKRAGRGTERGPGGRRPEEGGPVRALCRGYAPADAALYSPQGAAHRWRAERRPGGGFGKASLRARKGPSRTPLLCPRWRPLPGRKGAIADRDLPVPFRRRPFGRTGSNAFAARRFPRQRSPASGIGKGRGLLGEGRRRAARYSACGAPSPRRRRRNHSGGRTGRPSRLAQACWVMPSASRVLRSASVTLYTKVSEARPTSAIPART